MNALWKRWSALFDALGKRERIMVFSAAVFALAMIGYQFTIEPHRVRYAALSKNLAQQQSEKTEIEASVVLSEARARAPDAQNRAALLALRDRIAQVESEYRAVHDNLVAPEKMAELAQTLLRRNRGLQLVAMTTLPASPIVAELPPAAAQAGMPAAAIAVPGQDAGLYKHGVQITVRGSYADMTSYLVQLESLPQKMYWGRIEVLTEEYPAALLQFTVYTLSASKSWLVI
jgi:MSHA biogenesis protein MshJ